jgi:hypothetical protein
MRALWCPAGTLAADLTGTKLSEIAPPEPAHLRWPAHQFSEWRRSVYLSPHRRGEHPVCRAAPRERWRLILTGSKLSEIAPPEPAHLRWPAHQFSEWRRSVYLSAPAAISRAPIQPWRSGHVEVRVILHQGHRLFQGSRLKKSVADDGGLAWSGRVLGHAGRLVKSRTQVGHRAAALLIHAPQVPLPAFSCSWRDVGKHVPRPAENLLD